MPNTSPGAARLADVRAAFTSPPEQPRIGRRRSLPTTRAVVGGGLIAIAALGTFVLSSGAAADDRSVYVVAGRDLPAGSRITEADLATVQLSLNGSVASNAFSDKHGVVGATLLGPVKAGELVQGGAVLHKKSGANSPEISFALPASRAVGGDLRSGETVDVLVTKKNSDSEMATVAVSDARIIRIQGGNASGLSRTGDVTITVALRSRQEAALLAAALDGASVTLERTTGVEPAPPVLPPSTAQ